MDYDIVAGTDVVPYDTTLDKVDTIGKATVSIVLKGSGQVISKEYQYSKATAVLTTAKLKDNATLATAAAIGASQLKDLFDFEDQYDVAYTVQPADMTVKIVFGNSKVVFEGDIKIR